MDMGATWSTAVEIRLGGSSVSYPSIACDYTSKFLVIVEESGGSNIALAQSSDGITWEPTTIISTAAFSGTKSNARVAAFNGTSLVACWEIDESPTNRGVIVVTSFDWGASWNAEHWVGDTPNSFRNGTERKCHPVGDPNSRRVMVAFTSTNGPPANDTDIAFVTSADGGLTWSAERFTSYLNETSGDTSPILRYMDNKWILMWSTSAPYGMDGYPHMGTDSDIVVTYSQDFGDSWSPQTALNCPGAMNLSLATTDFVSGLHCGSLSGTPTCAVCFYSSFFCCASSHRSGLVSTRNARSALYECAGINGFISYLILHRVYFRGALRRAHRRVHSRSEEHDNDLAQPFASIPYRWVVAERLPRHGQC